MDMARHLLNCIGDTSVIGGLRPSGSTRHASERGYPARHFNQGPYRRPGTERDSDPNDEIKLIIIANDVECGILAGLGAAATQGTAGLYSFSQTRWRYQ